MVVSLPGKLQHHWPDKFPVANTADVSGKKAKVEKPVVESQAVSQKFDNGVAQEATAANRFGLKNVASNTFVSKEDSKKEPIFAKLGLHPATYAKSRVEASPAGKDNAAVEKHDTATTNEDFSATNMEVSAYKKPLKRVSLETKTSAPVETGPKQTLGSESSDSLKLQLRKAAPESTSAPSRTTPRTSQTVQMMGSSDKPSEQGKVALKKMERVGSDTSLEKGPTYKVGLKKTSSLVKPIPPSRSETGAYRKDLKPVAGAGHWTAHFNSPPTKVAETSHPSFRKADGTFKPSASTARPIYDSSLKQSRQRGGASAEESNGAKECPFSLKLKKVETSQPLLKKGDNAANSTSPDSKPIYNTSQKHNAGVACPVSMEANGEKEPASSLKLKKVGTHTRPATDIFPKPTYQLPSKKVSLQPSIVKDNKQKVLVDGEKTKDTVSSLHGSVVQKSGHLQDNSSESGRSRTSAIEELGELRARGLAKAVSTKGLETEDTAHKKEEHGELKALRSRGLAHIVVDSALKEKNRFEGRSKADQELVELRSKGLTKSMSKKGHFDQAARGSTEAVLSRNGPSVVCTTTSQEVENLPPMGSTQAFPSGGVASDYDKHIEHGEPKGFHPAGESEHGNKDNLDEKSRSNKADTASPVSGEENNFKEIQAEDAERIESKAGQEVERKTSSDEVSPTNQETETGNQLTGVMVTAFSSPAQGQIQMVLDSDDEDMMYLDTDDESAVLAILPQPHHEERSENLRGDSPAPAGNDLVASNDEARPEAATYGEKPVQMLRNRSKKSFEESATAFTPEEKAELRRQRKENKEKFKGVKRFIFGKKAVTSSG